MSAFDNYQQRGLAYDAQKALGDTLKRAAEFERELADLINKYSMENASGTPDFVLAAYLHQQLQIFNLTSIRRARWRGESVEMPALQKQGERERESTEDEALMDGVDTPPSGESDGD